MLGALGLMRLAWMCMARFGLQLLPQSAWGAGAGTGTSAALPASLLCAHAQPYTMDALQSSLLLRGVHAQS